MNRKPAKSLALAVLFIFIAIAACSMPGNFFTSSQPEDSGDPGTLQALETQIAQLQNNSDEAQEVEQETDPEPEATETPEPTIKPTIEHMVRPGEPGAAHSWVIDTSTKSLAGARESGADLFHTNLLERPFTSQVMDYQAYIDLTRVNLNISAPWVYVTFILEGPAPSDSTAIYALEVDLNSDGRGDWLLYGQVPDGIVWTTDGAKAYQDLNGDVGGPAPMNADPPNASRDGYETLVFDEGIGNDPDAVWIRRDPGNPNNVQLAFKYNLIGNDAAFAFGGWADDGLKNPGAFDYNDFMTFEEAGSAFSTNSRYPIKELASVDSTCRWTYGYTPTTAFPGLCPLPATPVPPGSISGGVFNDMNINGVKNGSEPGMPNVTVRIGAGACGSTGLANQSTAGNGSFLFENLEAGTYCVSVVNPNPSCGGWLPTTVIQRTVTLGPGEIKLIAWFGFSVYVC